MKGIKLWGFYSMGRRRLHAYPESAAGHIEFKNRLRLRLRSSYTSGGRCRGFGWGLVWFVFFFLWTWARQVPETELRSLLRSTVVGCVLLSDVLQDIKDELHHKRLVAPLAPPAGYDGSQHVIQGVQVLGRERLPIAPSHKPHLKKQTIPLQSLLEFTRVALL